MSAPRSNNGEGDRCAPPHGYALSPGDQRLLRGDPPAQALRWAAAAIGAGAQIGDVRALEGGNSSAVHAVDIYDHRGRTHRLVLRRFVRADWLAEEPDAPRHEAAALQVVRAGRVPTPRLVALDPDGREAGVPAILMTRLPGAIQWNPTDREAFLRQLAAVLPKIHATPLRPGSTIPPYQPYEPHIREPPPWASDPEVWQRAIEIFEGPAPPGERCLIHRDYHPGNVLWSGGLLTGIVDWVNASIGSRHADVGHCRANLADRLGLQSADRFLEHYQHVSGLGEYHPYWDIVAALGGYDQEDFAQPSPQDERFLAHACAQL